MIVRSIEIAGFVSNDISIISNTNGYESFGYPVFTDILKEKGPIGGIHAALTHSNSSHTFIIACDLPLLNSAFLSHMINTCEESDLMVVPKYGDQIEPLCAIYHKDCLAKIEKVVQSSDLSLHSFIDQNRVKFVDVDEQSPYYSPYLFSNANSLEELKKLETIHHES